MPRRSPGHSLFLPPPSALRSTEPQTALVNRSNARRRLVLGLALAIALAGGNLHAQTNPTFGDGPSIPPSIDEPSEVNASAGLVAIYRSVVDSDVRLTRIDAKPAFWMEDSSPHPRIPPGPWQAMWTGQLLVRDTGPIRFSAHLAGAVRMEVDGKVVLQGEGATKNSVIEAQENFESEGGSYPLRIYYRSLSEGPARLQIRWEGESFAPEPLPAWQLSHRLADRPAELAADQLAEAGRTLVERLGCARCHRSALPAIDDRLPGPSLAISHHRFDRTWLMDWLANPSSVRPLARMPALFPDDRTGCVQRAIIAEFLLQPSADSGHPPATQPPGDHRMGRRQFVELGCHACHTMPDAQPPEAPDGNRRPLVGLSDRFPADQLAAFLRDPHSRYPDARMPKIPMSDEEAQDIASFLLLWSPRSEPPTSAAEALPTADERAAVRQRLNADSDAEAAAALISEKGCARCHDGLDPAPQIDVPIAAERMDAGCLSPTSSHGPRYSLAEPDKAAIIAYLKVAPLEKHSSSFDKRQRLIHHLGCLRCHARDHAQPPPLEAIGSKLGGAWLQTIPYQRTPRLHFAHQKYLSSYLLSAVRDGVQVRRSPKYTYRMPAFGEHAYAAVQALAEADGDLPDEQSNSPVAVSPPSDPTRGSLYGPQLIGFQGYSCVSCHVWDGQLFADPDPGAIGPDLTRVVGRIRQPWFDRFLENPQRLCPGTPMPSAFQRGRPATLTTVLDGDAAAQRQAVWDYLSLGTKGPAPKPPPPMPVTVPEAGEPAVVAQIPLRVFDDTPLECIALFTADHDLAVYDLQTASLRSVRVGGQILRHVQGRVRTYTADGSAFGTDWLSDPAWQWKGADGHVLPIDQIVLHGYDHLGDGVRIRSEALTAAAKFSIAETIRIHKTDAGRRLSRLWLLRDLPKGSTILIRSQTPGATMLDSSSTIGAIQADTVDDVWTISFQPDAKGMAACCLTTDLPDAQSPQAASWMTLANPPLQEGSLARPGYQATVYPSPKGRSGEDLIVPVAIAAHPVDGRVFVASMKLGEIFVLDDPHGNGRHARFVDYAWGLFQDAYSLLAEEDALYVLHRRNLSRLVDTDDDGRADRVERVFAVPHGIADSYDYAYGLVRDREGAFVFSYAPYANRKLPGSGGAVRLPRGSSQVEPLAFGFRNPLGWSTGPEGEILFTDNQGEWVATNKLCVLSPEHFYGFPNPEQPEHASKPRGKAAVWIPYRWAHSINGLTFDNSEGKFGPFAGQVFMAELMFGGAIIRANLERINGVYQGACFPFWSRGLLGPMSLALDPAGRMWVASLTEPGWMAQPDRGAVFRIDYTGELPFEMQSIHVQPDGFRIQFTRPVDVSTAGDLNSYHVESYRYEYTGAYGSPELDRAEIPVRQATVSADAESVSLVLPEMATDRVYMITAEGVRSPDGESLLHPTGAYTLHEVPDPPTAAVQQP